MKITRNIWIAVIVFAVAVFLYVYPGIWRYTYFADGTKRVDRLTGTLRIQD